MREGRIGLDLEIINGHRLRYRDYLPVLEFLAENNR